MAAWTAADRRPVPELPGDHVVRDAQLVVTRSATIDAPPDRIWPWLVQVGWHRGGWYTARWVDRLLFPANRPSAKEILPEHQHLAVGDFVPDGPPETGCGFVVEELVPGRHLVLHSTSHLPRRWREAGVAAVDWTWSFNLLPLAGEATRLVFRWRARCTPWWLAAAARLLVVPADTFMSRSMLRGIRSRVEGGTAVERLSAQDLSMLWPDDLGWPQDIGAIGILDGGSLVEGTGRVRVDEARRAIACRLPMLPRFRQVVHVPRLGQGRRLWVDAPDVDLEWHVRVADLLDGEAGLLPAVERIRRQPLDRARPLWQVWFLSGLAGGRVGCFIRVHHAITDGVGVHIGHPVRRDVRAGATAGTRARRPHAVPGQHARVRRHPGACRGRGRPSQEDGACAAGELAGVARDDRGEGAADEPEPATRAAPHLHRGAWAS